MNSCHTPPQPLVPKLCLGTHCPRSSASPSQRVRSGASPAARSQAELGNENLVTPRRALRLRGRTALWTAATCRRFRRKKRKKAATSRRTPKNTGRPTHVRHHPPQVPTDRRRDGRVAGPASVHPRVCPTRRQTARRGRSSARRAAGRRRRQQHRQRRHGRRRSDAPRRRHQFRR